MKAMLLSETGPVEDSPLQVMEMPDPVPGPGEVRVKVTCCAVCRTDLHIVEGEVTGGIKPVIPGHQIVGIVDQFGPNCRRLKVGMRVGIAWLRQTCSTCRWCTAGRENLCPFSKYTGLHAHGGYAEYATVPEDFAYELPEGFEDVAVSPLLCAGIIGYRAFKRCNLRHGGRLGIFGFGSSAHIIMQIARHRGHEVYVVSRGEGHRRLARELGTAWSGADPTQMPGRVEAGIIFAPSGAAVPGALAALEPGGVLALAGIHLTAIPGLDYQAHLFGERDIHPVAANTREDGRELLGEAAAAGVRAHTKTYALAEANRALLDMKAGRIDGTGVLIMDT